MDTKLKMGENIYMYGILKQMGGVADIAGENMQMVFFIYRKYSILLGAEFVLLN